jgi:hypothetical protein
MAVTASGVLLAPDGNPQAGFGMEFALCNYGSQVPRLNSNGLAAVLNIPQVITDPDGSFTQTLVGNDLIVPAGTYYLVTIRNSNGDVIQCNAYIFTGNNSYNLGAATPFDPTQQPPPVIPPLIIPQINVINQGVAAPEYDGGSLTTFQLLLTTDVTGPYLANIIPGNLYTFITIQDAAGGHKFLYPSGPAPFGCVNWTDVDPTPNSVTTQTFVANDQGLLLPIAAGTWYEP